MAELKAGDRCKDCKCCKVWTSDRSKATCSLGIRPQGFHPDSQIPSKCIGEQRRNY